MKNHKNYGNRNQHRRELQPERPVTTKIGHNGQKVLMEYDRPVHNLMMTIEQVDQFIQNLEGAKKMLMDHQSKTAAEAAAQATPA